MYHGDNYLDKETFKANLLGVLGNRKGMVMKISNDHCDQHETKMTNLRNIVQGAWN
jgi:hypothetical protein